MPSLKLMCQLTTGDRVPDRLISSISVIHLLPPLFHLIRQLVLPCRLIKRGQATRGDLRGASSGVGDKSLTASAAALDSSRLH